jgi:alpha-N-arabinofuranosidase
VAFEIKRREFVKDAARCAGGLIAAQNFRAVTESQAEAAAASGARVLIDPKPLFEISPHLYMQFMEPLRATDPSVEAAWDYNHDDWRKDFLEACADLGPGMLRFRGFLGFRMLWPFYAT